MEFLGQEFRQFHLAKNDLVLAYTFSTAVTGRPVRHGDATETITPPPLLGR